MKNKLVVVEKELYYNLTVGQRNLMGEYFNESEFNGNMLHLGTLGLNPYKKPYIDDTYMVYKILHDTSNACHLFRQNQNGLTFVSIADDHSTYDITTSDDMVEALSYGTHEIGLQVDYIYNAFNTDKEEI